MKFEIQVGTDYSTVRFHPHNVKGMALLSIIETLMRIGGEMGDTVSDWTFPMWTTRHTINQVIRNTCFVCGGLMKDDYHEETKGAIKFNTAIRKCSSCGHSHT